MDRLNELRTQLQETAELTRQSRAEIAVMGKQVGATQQLVANLAQKPTEHPSTPKPSSAGAEMFSKFYGKSSLNGAFVLYVCYLSHKKKVGFDLSKLCESVKYLEQSYARGFLIACYSANVVDFTEASGIYNVTAFSEVIAVDIRKNLQERIEKDTKDIPEAKETFTRNVKIVDAMLTG